MSSCAFTENARSGINGSYQNYDSMVRSQTVSGLFRFSTQQWLSNGYRTTGALLDLS